jgi:hypothetical protein
LSSAAGNPSLHAGDIVFIGAGDLDQSGVDQSGVYGLIGNILTVVADRNTRIPGGRTTFGPFNDASTKVADIRAGEVVFQNDGIYVARSSGLETVADFTTRIPGGSGLRFNFFGPPAIDNGKTMFTGMHVFEIPPPPFPPSLGKPGVYSDIQDQVQSIIARSTQFLLDGKVVKQVFSGTGGLSDGRFVFKVTFFGGAEGVYIARPM